MTHLALPHTTTPPTQQVAEVFEQYGDYIYKVALFHTRDAAAAEDIYQDAFLSLLSKPIPDHVDNIKSYLYRMVTNDVIDAQRRDSTYKAKLEGYGEFQGKPTEQSNQQPDLALMRAEEAEKMFRILERQLPKAESEAVTLRYRDGLDTRQAARRMGIAPRSVSRYVSVAMTKLRDAFQDTKGAPK